MASAKDEGFLSKIGFEILQSRFYFKILQKRHFQFHNSCVFSRDFGSGAHCTGIDFALSFGAVIVEMIDLSKTESRDFFGIILDQKNSHKLHFLPKTC